MSRRWTARKPEETDLDTLRAWIAADPDHAGKCSAALWMTADPAQGAEVLVIEDEHGPVGFFRLTNVMRIDAQFPPLMGSMQEIEPGKFAPKEDGGTKLRVVKSLVAGLAWLREKARKRGVGELQFDSVSEKLIGFFDRQKFRKRSDVYEAKLF